VASLSAKRRKALWILTVGAGGTGFSSAIPTPTLEAPKQAAIALADIGLMAGIYTVYFDEDVGVDTIKDMLIEAGLIVSAGGGMAYGTIKATEAVMAEVLNWIPVIGWIISGTITASVTLSAGALWWWACDTAYRSGESPVTILKAAIG
jgi:hypothetical protein